MLIEYLISGYGVAVHGRNEKALLRMINLGENKIEDLIEINKENLSKEEKDKKKIEWFFEDEYSSLESIQDALNEEIFKDFSKEEYGLDYDISDDYYILLFSDVKYGTKSNLTEKDVDRIIKDLAIKIYDLDKDKEIDHQIIQEQMGVFGKMAFVNE